MAQILKALQIFEAEAIAAAGIDSQGISTDGLVAAAVRWTFSKGTGEKLEVDGTKGEFLALLQQDDLSGLDEHHVAIQGNYKS